MAQYLGFDPTDESQSEAPEPGTSTQDFHITPQRIYLVGSEDEDEEYAGLSQELYKMLKCEKCTKFMISEIHVCYSGHNICHECKMDINDMVCPLCESNISPILRNFEMETVASKIIIPCPHLGCPLVSFKGKIMRHAEICEHKKYPCPLLKYVIEEQCPWRGTLMNLLQHFEARHQHYMGVSHGNIIALRQFDPTSPLRHMHFFIYNSKFYLYHMYLNHQRGRISWVVQSVGPDSDAQDWTFDIQMANSFDSQRRLIFSDVCLPYSLNAEASLFNGTCASLHIDNIPLFTNEFGLIKFRFVLRYKGKFLNQGL